MTFSDFFPSFQEHIQHHLRSGSKILEWKHQHPIVLFNHVSRLYGLKLKGGSLGIHHFPHSEESAAVFWKCFRARFLGLGIYVYIYDWLKQMKKPSTMTVALLASRIQSISFHECFRDVDGSSPRSRKEKKSGLFFWVAFRSIWKLNGFGSCHQVLDNYNDDNIRTSKAGSSSSQICSSAKACAWPYGYTLDRLHRMGAL